jgi:glycine/D-amino acid oxidase-like deaminating enzyme
VGAGTQNILHLSQQSWGPLNSSVIMPLQQTNSIVIIGGGIIGCTTAYYLSQRPGYQITLLEASRHGVAQGASGKAGGLVAKWAYPKELVNVSFHEHVALAAKLNGASRYGWRLVNCGSWEGRAEVEGQRMGDGKTKPKSLEKTLSLVDVRDVPKGVSVSRKKAGLPDDLNWVLEDLTDSYSPMAAIGDTAQVYPYEFTSTMLELARENGVNFVAGRAMSLTIDGRIKEGLGQKITGVEYQDLETGDTKSVQCSHVILAAGAWSPTLLPKSGLPVSATRAHSITLCPQGDTLISPYVLFTDIRIPPTADGCLTDASPELYARPNNQVYACGPGDDSPLPDAVDEVQVDEVACDRIRRHVSGISKELREAEVDKRQACFLPYVTFGGGPIIGEARSIAEGLIIATGHTCWVSCGLTFANV